MTSYQAKSKATRTGFNGGDWRPVKFLIWAVSSFIVGQLGLASNLIGAAWVWDVMTNVPLFWLTLIGGIVTNTVFIVAMIRFGWKRWGEPDKWTLR